VKIPYDKDLRMYFIVLAGILVAFYLFIFLYDPSSRYPSSWIDVLLCFFPLILIGAIFILTYHWYMIDFDGLKVHYLIKKATLCKWSEFSYIGPTVITINSNHVKILTCATKLPYKKFKRSESFILSKGSITYRYSDELCEALRKYCPNFSTEFENP